MCYGFESVTFLSCQTSNWQIPNSFSLTQTISLVPSKTLKLWNFFLAIYCKGIQYSLILHKALDLFLSLYFESLCLINFHLCLIANLNSYPQISVPWFSFFSSYIMSSCTRLEAVEPLNSEAHNNLPIPHPLCNVTLHLELFAFTFSLQIGQRQQVCAALTQTPCLSRDFGE